MMGFIRFRDGDSVGGSDWDIGLVTEVIAHFQKNLINYSRSSVCLRLYYNLYLVNTESIISLRM